MTVREPFVDGQVAEAGAMILASKVIEDYVAEFILETAPADLNSMRAAPYYLRGQRIEADSDGAFDWPLDVKDDEQGLGRSALLGKYWYGPTSEYRKSLQFSDHPFPELRALDQVSFADFLRQQGASDAAIEIMSIGYFDQVGDGPETYSALSAMTDIVAFSSLEMTKPAFQIVGGNDLLPNLLRSDWVAMCDSIRRCVRLSRMKTACI